MDHLQINYYAITINNKKLMEDLTSINKAYDFLSPLGMVYIIAAERNDLNYNTHYHALISNDKSPDEMLQIATDNQIWAGNIIEEVELQKYYSYCKKDGKYKLYNKFNVSDTLTNSQIIELVRSYSSLQMLFIDYPELINKVSMIKQLWNIYRD